MTQTQRKLCGAVLLSGILAGCARSPQARRDGYLAKGREFFQKQQYSRAILEFRNAAQVMPKDPDVYYELGGAFTATRDFRSAVTAYRKALDLNPKHAGSQLRLSQMMVASNDPNLLKEAEARLREMLQNAMVTPEVLNTLALTELQLGKTEDAVQNLEQVLASQPQALQASVTLARTKLSTGDAKGAEEVLKKACDAAPNAPGPRDVLGKFYSALKRFPEAEEQFKRALQLDAKSDSALLDLGNLQYAMGRKQEAEEIFKRLSAAGAKRYRPAHGMFLFQEGRRDEGIREFEKIAKEDPEDRVARTRLVRAYQAANRKADAEKVLAAVLKKNPRDLDALTQRGELFLEAGKFSAAEMDLNLVLQLKPDSAELHYTLAGLHKARGATLQYRQQLYEALRLNPFLVPVRVELAQALINGKEPKAALDVLKNCPESQADLTQFLIQRNWALWSLGDMAEMRKGIDEGLGRDRALGFLLQDGLWKLRQGNPAGARASLEEALKINPSDIRALDTLRQTYIAQKQGSVALQKVKEYVAQQPNSAPAQQFLGTLLMADGQRDQARVAFAAAKKVEPQFVNADLSLVQMAIVDKNLDEAQKRLQDVVAANGQLIQARHWLGNVELMKGNSAAAIEQFRQVVDSQPDNADALNNLAYLLGEQPAHLDDALKYAEKARERAPKDSEIADTLGWICYRKGLYSLAIQHLEPAAAGSRNPVLKYHLAMAYAKAGNAERARTMLSVALKANPNLPEAAEASKVVGN